MLDVLLIDDEVELREPLEEMLRDAGHNVQTAADGTEGADRLNRRVFDVVICDVRLPGIDGLTLFRTARKQTPETEFILVTAYADVGQAVSALKEGAYDYLMKPFDVDELLVQLRRIDENRALRRELDKVRGELSGRTSAVTLVGDSPVIRRVVEKTKMVASSDVPVLVTGESGTGKELVARADPQPERAPRRSRSSPSTAAALARDADRERAVRPRARRLHRRREQPGRACFEAADGGTLFLDEIGEMPLAAPGEAAARAARGHVRAAAARTAGEGGRAHHLGHAPEPQRTDEAAAASARTCTTGSTSSRSSSPPCASAPDDLPLLLRHFIQKFLPPGAPVPNVSPAAWAALVQYGFPGNIRELSHAVEHALVLSGGKEIDLQHLPPTMADGAGNGPLVTATPTAIRPLQTALREFELQYLRRALKAADGKRTRAAEMLGISRKTLWEKLRYGGFNHHEHEHDHDLEHEEEVAGTANVG